MIDPRTAGLGGLALGVGFSPLAAGLDPQLGVAPVAGLGLAAAVLRNRAGWRELGVAATALLLVAVGLLLGTLRLAQIDGAAYRGQEGRPAQAVGTVISVPRRSRGQVRVEVATADGKLLLTASEPVPDLPVGGEVRASGVLQEPDPFLDGLLRRHGIAQVLRAERIEATGRRRGGVAGGLDLVRRRAEAALNRGMREPEAALARGFVLGEDDRIDPATVDDFKRSGLAHLLAVSGQNVVLLALLAMPILALAGLSLRARLVAILGLVAVYVPVAGAGPSIQRAGVMGAAAIAAALASRPRSRVHVVILAALVTLLLNPRASGEIGWQLSFVAVIGILLWARPIGEAFGAIGAEGWRSALADGAAITIAATVATAPLMAHHFEAVSVAALPANLLALPAVAPAMWLGMLSAAAGQLPVMPVEVLNAVNQLLLAYISQVADWFAAPSWAQAPVRLTSPLAVVSVYAALIAGGELLARARRRRLSLRLGRRAALATGLPVALIAVTALASAAGNAAPDTDRAPPGHFRATFLDVGQGDAILLQPPGGGAVLIDGGPPGEDLAGSLADRGVERLALAVVTHDQLDHVGGLTELFGRLPVESLAYAFAGPELLGAAAANGTATERLAEGAELRSGELRIRVLWPPRESRPAGDPNRVSVVLLAEWRHFSILLTGDAEQESSDLDPGTFDVLKVAHHGSADAGLDSLLEQALPDLAVISVGDNSYGHPAPETLSSLRDHDLPILRTDERGSIEIEADSSGWAVEGGQ